MQVTNHRSNLRKPEVPLTTNPVSKLQTIGKETVAKLRDLRAALASAHHEDVQVLEDYVRFKDTGPQARNSPAMQSGT